MWKKLNFEDREKYKTFIINFSSLSEAFAQKENDNNQKIIAPIINSKYQETAFRRAFNATIEDIGNSSFDASIKLESGEKYIIGIKSFGVGAGYQKIAQFKSDSQKDNWDTIIDRIKQRKKNGISLDDKKDYRELAIKIATLRNKRINSSKSQLQGFEMSDDVNAVYHVLMPSKAVDVVRETDEPYIIVGETTYNSIDINNMIIDGPTKKDTLQNFRFHDRYHQYQYNSADSQLLMSFKGEKTHSNEEIGIDKWSITYVKDALSFFENLNNIVPRYENDHIMESYTFMIEPELRSGFNAWYGAPKSKLDVNSNKYLNIKKQANIAIKNNDLSKEWLTKFKHVVIDSFHSNDQKLEREKLRDQLINEINKGKYQELFDATTTALWRNYKTPYEVYLPIPNSKKFNIAHPNFFKEGAGRLSGEKLIVKKEKRSFVLRFMPSMEEMEMFLNQDNGKAIQSLHSQFKFGKWVLKNIFQLKDRELLTNDTLKLIGINAMTFTKYDDGRPMSMEFAYVNDVNKYKYNIWE